MAQCCHGLEGLVASANIDHECIEVFSFELEFLYYFWETSYINLLVLH